MSAHNIGSTKVTRVWEWVGPLFTRSQLPDSDSRRWQENAAWLEPDFWSAESDNAWTHSQSFLVQTDQTTVLIDTGIGNHKPRPQVPPFSDLNTEYLARLADAGVTPDDIDVVVCTHLHPDHVGWNTSLRDGAWLPTFPRATYLFPAADLEFLSGGSPDDPAYQDSIAPVVSAGLAETWSGDHHVIDDSLTLHAAIGHSAGASVVELSSGGEHLLFSGDLMHSPMQILEPDGLNILDADPKQAAQSRRQWLRWASDREAPLLGAHFGSHRFPTVGARGDEFVITSWFTLDEPAHRHSS